MGSMNRLMTKIYENRNGSVLLIRAQQRFTFLPTYKKYQYGMPITEHSNVLRLAEQYLIRAESAYQLERFYRSTR